MTIDILGNDDKKIFPVHLDDRRAAFDAAAWPLPSVVYSIGFQLTSEKKVVLLSNTNNTAAAVNVQGAKGGTIHTVDASAGYGEVPYSTAKVQTDSIALAPSAFSLIELIAA